MSETRTIKCIFCQGTGNNPHFRGTCPVCKGKGKNKVVGKYMACGSCRGSGGKGGTTLTCYDCGGLGVIPDTRETFRQAREEIRQAQKEMAGERPARQRPEPQAMAGGAELTEKPVMEVTELLNLLEKKDEKDDKIHFCQCCGDEVDKSVKVKICFDCLNKVRELRTNKE